MRIDEYRNHDSKSTMNTIVSYSHTAQAPHLPTILFIVVRLRCIDCVVLNVECGAHTHKHTNIVRLATTQTKIIRVYNFPLHYGSRKIFGYSANTRNSHICAHSFECKCNGANLCCDLHALSVAALERSGCGVVKWRKYFITKTPNPIIPFGW